MATRQIRVVQPTDQVKVIFGAGDEYRYLATGDQTDGGYFLVEAIVPPAGIEGLFEEFAEMSEPTGDFATIITSLNVLGEKYGVEYFSQSLSGRTTALNGLGPSLQRTSDPRSSRTQAELRVAQCDPSASGEGS